VLDKGEWSTSLPGHFSPGVETRYPLNKKLDGPQRRSARLGEEINLLPLPDFERRFAQRIRYNNWPSDNKLRPIVTKQQALGAG
jgi:hypothetical protein